MTTSSGLASLSRLATILAVAIPITVASPARADDLFGDERGFNRVKQGVWELSIGSLFAFNNDHQGDASVLRLATDASAAVDYFFKDNLSVGVIGLVNYNSNGDDNTAITLGGAVGITAHLRLGHSAFFRPGLALGALFGNREIPVAGSTVMEAPQVGFTARVKLPIAYFISQNLHVEGGPQFNVTAGSFTPEGAESVAFTTIDGGFSVGCGYSF